MVYDQNEDTPTKTNKSARATPDSGLSKSADTAVIKSSVKCAKAPGPHQNVGDRKHFEKQSIHRLYKRSKTQLHHMNYTLHFSKNGMP